MLFNRGMCIYRKSYRKWYTRKVEKRSIPRAFQLIWRAEVLRIWQYPLNLKVCCIIGKGELTVCGPGQSSTDQGNRHIFLGGWKPSGNQGTCLQWSFRLVGCFLTRLSRNDQWVGTRYSLKMEESIKAAHSPKMKEFICICAVYNCMQAGKTELASERTEILALK